MIRELTTADFTPYLHQTFQMQRSADLPVTVELISVQAVGANIGADAKTADEAEGEPFSVVFRGSAYAYLPQSQYTVAHPELGLLSFVLMPIGVDEAGIRYEATFH